MSSTIVCRACQAKVAVPKDEAIKRVKCPKCQTLLSLVPADPTANRAVADAPGKTAPKSRESEEDDDDDDDDRPDANRNSAPRMPIVPLVLIGGGTLLLLAFCGIGGWWLFRPSRPPANIEVVSEKKIPGLVGKNNIPGPTPRPADPPTNPGAVPRLPISLPPDSSIFTKAPGVEWVTPYPLSPYDWGAFGGSNWSAKIGPMHENNTWKTDHYSVCVLKNTPPIANRPTADNYIKLLLRHDRNYSQHKVDEEILRKEIAIGGYSGLAVLLRERGQFRAKDTREYNFTYVVTNGKILAIINFKTFAGAANEAIVSGVLDHFKFTP